MHDTPHDNLEVNKLADFGIQLGFFLTQGLILARQALYHLNWSVSPVLCWVF
jgi:hypothetical protein